MTMFPECSKDSVDLVCDRIKDGIVVWTCPTCKFMLTEKLQ